MLAGLSCDWLWCVAMMEEGFLDFPVALSLG